MVGMLYVDEHRLEFVARTGSEVHAARDECQLRWRRGKGLGLIPSFDLQLGSGDILRFYTSRPSTTAPLFDAGTLAQIAEKLSAAGALEVFGGLIGALGGAAGNLDDLATLPRDWAELRAGRRFASQMKSLWA
jgi:hypothetical protein